MCIFSKVGKYVWYRAHLDTEVKNIQFNVMTLMLRILLRSVPV
ncbi:hypothetical protein SAMN04515619_12353 [Collimonas sp. OK412]|nr:hypothetical protein SAMN04515619_12353 [Collimonas sp. OK412]